MFLDFFIGAYTRMGLRRANPLIGALEGVGPSNGSCPPKSQYVPRHINNRYINLVNFAIYFFLKTKCEYYLFFLPK
jgi:hypothetical protein